MSAIQHNLARVEETGQQFITAIVGARLMPPVDNSHPNFERILDACTRSFNGEEIDTEWFIDLFDVAETVAKQFEQLSERVSVRDGVLLLDGDPVHGALQDQILKFLDQGEDFAPLVRFYEKLLTNPLGDVREGLYSWITGGNPGAGRVTITEDGDLLGYKSMHSRAPEWREGVGDTVYVPSRRGEGVVNGREVAADEYIEQVEGDVVQMPRSRVLNAPSQACGDGLHIGTWEYAESFQGDTVMLVQFSPRDIVSLPDSNSTWKLRVCRYTNVEPVTEPLDDAVYHGGAEETASPNVGDRVCDPDGDEGTVVSVDRDGHPVVEYDSPTLGTMSYTEHGYEDSQWEFLDIGDDCVLDLDVALPQRHPAQDDKGRFSQGRPGSARDASSGRFC